MEHQHLGTVPEPPHADREKRKILNKIPKLETPSSAGAALLEPPLCRRVTARDARAVETGARAGDALPPTSAGQHRQVPSRALDRSRQLVGTHRAASFTNLALSISKKTPGQDSPAAELPKLFQAGTIRPTAELLTQAGARRTRDMNLSEAGLRARRTEPLPLRPDGTRLTRAALNSRGGTGKSLAH